jgi:hypothetical protein
MEVFRHWQERRVFEEERQCEYDAAYRVIRAGGGRCFGRYTPILTNNSPRGENPIPIFRNAQAVTADSIERLPRKPPPTV